MTQKPETHDEYLAILPDARRVALEALRREVNAALPGEAREVFSYGIPAWRAGPGKGHVIVGYAAMRNHLGFYAFDGDVIGRMAGELTDFPTAKGTVRFTPDHPLPPALIRKIVAARLEEVGL